MNCGAQLLPALLLALVLAAVPSAAQERPPGDRVVLLLVDAPREGLTDALKIHVPRGTRVLVAPAPGAPSTAGRVREAQRTLAMEERGMVAMWLDEERVDGGDREIIVYLVARRDGRALVEVVRVRATAVEELDRAIAVKMREVIDAVERDDGDLAGAIAPSTDGSPRPPVASAGSRIGLGPLVELDAFGATASGSAGPQVGGKGTAGLAVSGDAWLAEIVGSARVTSALSNETRAGSVEASDMALHGGVRALWTTSSVGVGGFVHVGGRMLEAEGTTSLGASGTASRVVPFVAFGPEIRVSLVQPLRLRAAFGTELALGRQKFALNQEPVVDVGLARGVAEVGLTATFF